MNKAKEKAEELVSVYFLLVQTIAQQKQCALIAVDEILNNFGLRTNGQNFYTEYRAVEYYQEVKKEIEKL
jgi:hypothetical protein